MHLPHLPSCPRFPSLSPCAGRNPCDLRRAANAPDVQRRAGVATARSGGSEDRRGRWNAIRRWAVAWIPACAGMTQWGMTRTFRQTPTDTSRCLFIVMHLPHFPSFATFRHSCAFHHSLRRQESMRSEARPSRPATSTSQTGSKGWSCSRGWSGALRRSMQGGSAGAHSEIAPPRGSPAEACPCAGRGQRGRPDGGPAGGVGSLPLSRYATAPLGGSSWIGLQATFGPCSRRS